MKSCDVFFPEGIGPNEENGTIRDGGCGECCVRTHDINQENMLNYIDELKFLLLKAEEIYKRKFPS